MDGVLAFSRIMSPVVSPCPSSYGWCVRLLQGLVSPCLPFLPLSSLVSPCTPAYGWCARLLKGLVCACAPSGWLVAFSKVSSPFVSPCAPSYGWIVRLLQGLVSLSLCPPCLPLYPFICMCPPSPGSCLSLYPNKMNKVASLLEPATSEYRARRVFFNDDLA